MMIAIAKPRRRCRYRNLKVEPEAEAFAAGCPEAFTAIYERYNKRLLGLARFYLWREANPGEEVDEHEAEEIVQATFTKIWEKRHEDSHYKPHKPVLVWLWCRVRITYLGRRNYRSARSGNVRRPRSLDEVKTKAGDITRAVTDTVADVLEREEQPRRRERIKRLLDGLVDLYNRHADRPIRRTEANLARLEVELANLKQSYVEIIVCRAMGMTHKATAEHLGIVLRSAQSRIVYAMDALIEAMQASKAKATRRSRTASQLSAWAQRVAACREAGWTFAEIGAAMGTSKEAVQQRFKRHLAQPAKYAGQPA